MARWPKVIAALLLALLVVGPTYASRDGAGNYTVPNTFTPGDTITASDHNENWSDIATEITNSLPRDGQAAMTGQFKATTGTAAAPSISFGSDTDTGILRPSTNTLGFSVGGSSVATLNSSGLTLPSGDITLTSGEITGVGTAWVGATQCGFRATAPDGWLFAAGKTIGNASSGATARANADTEELFVELYVATTNTDLPIQDSSGVASTRTGSDAAAAATDFAANKRLPLPDLRERQMVGAGNMDGRTSPGLITSSVSGCDGEALADKCGAEGRTVAKANLPNYALDSTLSIIGTQSVTLPRGGNTDSADFPDGGGSVSVAGVNNYVFNVNGSSFSISGSVTLGGSGTTLATQDPTIVANCFIKY